MTIAEWIDALAAESALPHDRLLYTALTPEQFASLTPSGQLTWGAFRDWCEEAGKTDLVALISLVQTPVIEGHGLRPYALGNLYCWEGHTKYHKEVPSNVPHHLTGGFTNINLPSLPDAYSWLFQQVENLGIHPCISLPTK